MGKGRRRVSGSGSSDTASSHSVVEVTFDEMECWQIRREDSAERAETAEKMYLCGLGACFLLTETVAVVVVGVVGVPVLTVLVSQGLRVLDPLRHQPVAVHPERLQDRAGDLPRLDRVVDGPHRHRCRRDE